MSFPRFNPGEPIRSSLSKSLHRLAIQQAKYTFFWRFATENEKIGFEKISDNFP